MKVDIFKMTSCITSNTQRIQNKLRKKIKSDFAIQENFGGWKMPLSLASER